MYYGSKSLFGDGLAFIIQTMGAKKHSMKAKQGAMKKSMKVKNVPKVSKMASKVKGILKKSSDKSTKVTKVKKEKKKHKKSDDSDDDTDALHTEIEISDDGMTVNMTTVKMMMAMTVAATVIKDKVEILGTKNTTCSAHRV